MGVRMPETCWAVSKRQVIYLRSCCILLVDSVESFPEFLICYIKLTLILLTWSIGWAPNNASRWQMVFNSAFKGLTYMSPYIKQNFYSSQNEIYILLRHYAEYSSNSLPTFRNNPWSHFQWSRNIRRKISWPLKMRQIGCPETSRKELPTIRCVMSHKERRSDLHHGGSLKSIQSTLFFKIKNPQQLIW